MGLSMFRNMASIFILCSVLTSALCCDWLNHCSNLRNSSLVLIEVMGGPFTNQRSPVQFPYKLYNRMRKNKENCQLIFIRDSLKHIYDLYSHNDGVLPAAWDSVKTKDFLESIYRQIVELDQCPKSRCSEKQNKRLRDSYENLKNQTLDRYGGSRDGWELLRLETKNHLMRLDLLGNQLSHSGRHAASRSL